MPTRLSLALNVNEDQLESKGVYNCLIDFDNRLHIDPALFLNCDIPEFRNASREIVKYFTSILRLVKASKKKGDLFWNKALKMISRGEGLNTGLGYARNGVKGSGIGERLGSNILETIKLICEAGVDDPSIFELVGIFEPNVGADRISDLISVILKQNFAKYTARVTKELNILNTTIFKTDNVEYIVPLNPHTNEYLILVPAKVLNDLPIAELWDDFPFASIQNETTREYLNELLVESWREMNSKTKKEIRDILLESPTLIQELIELYKNRNRASYDFDLDHLGVLLWDSLGYAIGTQERLDLQHFIPLKVDAVKDVVWTICLKFKQLIENNGLVEHLYDGTGKKRPERFPQLLLYAVADSYCSANNLDLSREPNAGSGALDFKFSNGLAKVNVEIKYSSNGKLIEGYQKQLAAYNAAENVKGQNSIYMIIQVKNSSAHNSKIEQIKSIIRECERLKESCSQLIVINGIKQPSASNR